jgi:hypothetical protein
VGPCGSRQVPADHPPRPAGWLGRASPAGWPGWARPAGCPRWEGQPAACREGRRGSRLRPLTGPPADHGVMTPSRAGKRFHAIARRAAEPGPLTAAGRVPGRARARLTSGAAAVWCCAQSSTWLAARGELAARARLCHGPVDRPRCQAQRARAGPVDPLDRGLETGRAWAPSRQRRTSSLPAGRPPVRREARALFPRLPLSTARGRLGARPATAWEPRPGRPGRGREPRPRCGVNWVQIWLCRAERGHR